MLFVKKRRIFVFDYFLDPIQLDQTMYAAGFDSKHKTLIDSDGEEEKYPSRIPFDQTKLETATRSPKVLARKKDKKAKPVFDMDGKIQKVQIA